LNYRSQFGRSATKIIAFLLNFRASRFFRWPEVEILPLATQAIPHFLQAQQNEVRSNPVRFFDSTKSATTDQPTANSGKFKSERSEIDSCGLAGSVDSHGV